MTTNSENNRNNDKAGEINREKHKPAAKKARYVSHDELLAFQKGIEAAVNTALEEQFKNVEELVSSKINASNAEISKALMQHGEAINSIAAAIQGGQIQQPQQQQMQQQPAGQPINRQARLEEITNLVNQITEIPWVKEKLGLTPADPVDQVWAAKLQNNITRLYNNSLKIAATASERVLQKEINLTTKELAKGIVSDGLAEHGI